MDLWTYTCYFAKKSSNGKQIPKSCSYIVVCIWNKIKTSHYIYIYIDYTCLGKDLCQGDLCTLVDGSLRCKNGKASLCICQFTHSVEDWPWKAPNVYNSTWEQTCYMWEIPWSKWEVALQRDQEAETNRDPCTRNRKVSFCCQSQTKSPPTVC